MSDPIKHECGIAMIKLKKPVQHYAEKYGTPFYAINKMYLLMEKQHNRGQDGAGLACIKNDSLPGNPFIYRKRSVNSKPIADIFRSVNKKIRQWNKAGGDLKNPALMQKEAPFIGETYLGHLRYGTYGGNTIEACHPFIRYNSWKARNLVVAGNFNMTNVDALFQKLLSLGQHPKEKADTITVMEKIGHFLDLEVQKKFNKYKDQGYSNSDISEVLEKDLDLRYILQKSAEDWDGGYAMAGIVGQGDSFVLRDPNGIRPCFYYDDEEITVVASERPVIQTAFDLPIDAIKPLPPGHALIMKVNGETKIREVKAPGEELQCSFERIYFSRGSDKDIYNERKELGNSLAPRVMQELNHDYNNTIFSFIPNTAETAFYGLVKGVENSLDAVKAKRIVELGSNATKEQVENILADRTRIEKIAIKDAKLRTFITDDSGRDDLVTHVYDVTYGTVNSGKDTLVVLDDSIVRGTTLKKSILRILDRLKPKKIMVVSSAPQIRYPDCYGIDMAKLGDFIAFQAAVALHKERGTESVLKDVYDKCIADISNIDGNKVNHVKEVYAPFTQEEIEKKIAELITSPGINAEIQVVYQSVDGLHKACPNHKGDWYFTGDYPTAGGKRVVNRSFINYFEGKNERAY